MAGNESSAAFLNENTEDVAAGLAREERPLGEIDTLTVRGGIDVEFVRGQMRRLEVFAASREALRDILTEEHGAELVVMSQGTTIRLDGNVVSVHGSMNMVAGRSIIIDGQKISQPAVPGQRLTILGKDGTKMVFSGGVGSITMGDIVNGGRGGVSRALVRITSPVAPDVMVEGSGDVRLTDIDQPSISFGVRGSGDIRARGKVDKLEISIQGSGDVKAKHLIAARGRVTIAGSGDVSVNITQEAKVSVAGSGEVVVRGNPARREKSVCGSGRVRFKDE